MKQPAFLPGDLEGIGLGRNDLAAVGYLVALKWAALFDDDSVSFVAAEKQIHRLLDGLYRQDQGDGQFGLEVKP